jgi:predicted nucleic acid-binding Zn ribbon protein
MSDAPLTTCPECGNQTFSKQLSAPSFQLSGSGWYATDFKGGAKPAESKTEESKPAGTKEEVKASAPCATGCACH